MIILSYLTRPRLWEWERLGTGRTRLVAAGTGMAVIASALLPIIATVIALPAGFRWAWLAANVLIAGAAVQIGAAILGPALGGGTVLVLYFVDAILDNAAPALSHYLPLTPYSHLVMPIPNMTTPGRPAHWILAAVLITAAIAPVIATHSASIWSIRHTRNET